MNFVVGITGEFLESVLQLHDCPEEFFRSLVVELHKQNYQCHMAFRARVLGGSLSLLLECFETFKPYAELGFICEAIADRLRDLGQRSRVSTFQDCSRDYVRHLEGIKKWPVKVKKDPVDFIFSSKALSDARALKPHHIFQVAWEKGNDLKQAMVVNDPKKTTYWCFDFDETLFSTLQGAARLNHHLMRSMQKLVQQGCACILTARTDPLYLYNLVVTLLASPECSIDVPISKFDRKKFEDLSPQCINTLNRRVTEHISCSVTPRHRKELLRELMAHLKAVLYTDVDDKSPWEVEEIPRNGLIFFMNTRVQMLVNDRAPHLFKWPALKGDFARMIWSSYPHFSRVVLVDDNQAQCDDWRDVSERAVAYRVQQSFLGDIPLVCREIARLASDKFFLRPDPPSTITNTKAL